MSIITFVASNFPCTIKSLEAGARSTLGNNFDINAVKEILPVHMPSRDSTGADFKVTSQALDVAMTAHFPHLKLFLEKDLDKRVFKSGRVEVAKSRRRNI